MVGCLGLGLFYVIGLFVKALLCDWASRKGEGLVVGGALL